MGIVTLLADWLGFGNAEGFGRHQMMGCLLGAGLTASGIFLAWREGSWSRHSELRTGAVAGSTQS
jgi:hypothetical protein